MVIVVDRTSRSVKMIIIKQILIIFFVSIYITGCFNSQKENYGEKKPLLNSRAKYEIKDCVVQLRFNWKNKNTDKMFVIDSISEGIKKAIASGRYPRLSANSFKGYSYVFFFSDKCEKRKIFVEEIISEFISPSIKKLPSYQIVIPSIEDIKKSPTFPRNNWWINKAGE